MVRRDKSRTYRLGVEGNDNTKKMIFFKKIISKGISRVVTISSFCSHDRSKLLGMKGKIHTYRTACLLTIAASLSGLFVASTAAW